MQEAPNSHGPNGWRGEALLLPVVLIFLFAFVFGSGPALADAPLPYDGAMQFRAIHGPSDPEDFSWEVHLGPGEQLEAINDQQAYVVWEDGTKAMGISALAAHDADGTAVPTTIAVSGTNIVTLTVHHRAGNPAAGGASFDYPVSAGVGWEGGFHTYYSTFTEPEAAPTPPASGCVVPKLAGRTLKNSRNQLKAAGCELGKVRGERAKRATVARQSPKPGRALPSGAKVEVKLG